MLIAFMEDMRINRIMSERLTKLLIVLVAGWLLGYMHHFFATRPEVRELKSNVDRLESELVKARSTSMVPKKVSVKTTAYSNDAGSINVRRWRDKRTATNKLAKRGYVAADWRVFPPGTRLFIPGYGEAVVEDRGGLVKGLHLDLFVDSRKEALDWGVRELDILVFEKGRKET